MGLSDLSDMYRSGEISAREANELDGVNDDGFYCDICDELVHEDDLYVCDNCGCQMCDNCLTVVNYGNYCSLECARNDS